VVGAGEAGDRVGTNAKSVSGSCAEGKGGVDLAGKESRTKDKTCRCQVGGSSPSRGVGVDALGLGKTLGGGS